MSAVTPDHMPVFYSLNIPRPCRMVPLNCAMGSVRPPLTDGFIVAMLASCSQGYWATTQGTVSSYFWVFRATFLGGLTRPRQQLMGTGSSVCIRNSACNTETHSKSTKHLSRFQCQQDPADSLHQRENLFKTHWQNSKRFIKVEYEDCEEKEVKQRIPPQLM